MFSKEQVFCLLLAALMIVTLTACGKRTDTTKPSDSNQTAEQSPTQGTDNSQGNNNSETSGKKTDGNDKSVTPEYANACFPISFIDVLAKFIVESFWQL